jgi:hypothetical protein
MNTKGLLRSTFFPGAQRSVFRLHSELPFECHHLGLRNVDSLYDMKTGGTGNDVDDLCTGIVLAQVI